MVQSIFLMRFRFKNKTSMDIAQQVPQHPRVRDVLADQCQRLFFEYLER